MKTVVFLYEPGQLVSLDALMSTWGARGDIPHLVSLDAEIDYELERRGIAFTSGKELQNRETPASYMRSDELTQDLCESEELSFLQYKNISLLRPLRLSVHQYLQTLMYYIELVSRFADTAGGIEYILVPAPTTPVSKTSGSLAEHEVYVVVEAARRVAESRGIAFEMLQSMPVSVRLGNRLKKITTSYQRTLFGVTLSFLNIAISLQPKRPLRILASDYWRNLAPLLQKVPEAEVVLLDRSEALKAGFGNIWRHKMRFVHISSFLSWQQKRTALTHARECRTRWEAVRPQAWPDVDFMFCGVSLAPVCERIMTRLINHAVPQVVCTIAGTYVMYENLAPSVVLLRASVSAQIHFAVLPLVARQVGIPALEVQHGGDYFGPGSPTRDRAAYFFATYGPLVCNELRALEYEPERLLAVGSPRFDAYVEGAKKMVVKKGKGLSILSNTPNINIGERFGTYSIEEYFKALGEAVAGIPEARLVIASRSAGLHTSFTEEARVRGLSGTAYEHAGPKPLPQLFEQADIFVCSHSTVVYEALLYRLPVIVASFAPVEKMMSEFHFGPFRDAGALMIVHTQQELSTALKKLATDPEARARMSAAGWDFMQKNFSFDGRASERIAEFIRRPLQPRAVAACAR